MWGGLEPAPLSTTHMLTLVYLALYTGGINKDEKPGLRKLKEILDKLSAGKLKDKKKTLQNRLQAIHQEAERRRHGG